MMRNWDETEMLELVRRSAAQGLPPGRPMPGDGEDLVKAGLIDSMGWVEILSAIEGAAGIQNFGSVWPEGRPQSIGALVEALRESVGERVAETGEREDSWASGDSDAAVAVVGWGSALGSLSVSAEDIERECGLAPGALRDGAGIESVCRANDTENELVL